MDINHTQSNQEENNKPNITVWRSGLLSAEQMKNLNQDELIKIKKNSKPVVFISGHFNNFELMALHLERSGIDLAAIYRPLNNKFLNPIMEKIRKRYKRRN